MGRVVMITSTVLFVLVAAVHLWAQATGPIEVLEVSLVLLMPLLIISVLSAARRFDRTVGLVTLALLLSWLGDSSGTALVRAVLVGSGFSWASALAAGAFVVKLGLFLVAHLFYIAALAPLWRDSVLGRGRWRLLPYGAAGVVIVGLLMPYAAVLAGAVVVYALVITVMAVFATGAGRLTTIGGVLFMLSDTLVAVQQFVPGFNVRTTGVVIMITYVAAQALLAYGVVGAGRHRARRDDSTGAERGAGSGPVKSP